MITGGWEVWGKGGEKEAEQKVPKHSCIEGVSSWLSTLWWRGYQWTVIHNNRLYTGEKKTGREVLTGSKCKEKYGIGRVNYLI